MHNSADVLLNAQGELRRAFDATPIVDSHEHLLQEERRLAQNLSFAHLFFNYLQDDLISAGMPRGDLDRFFSEETPPDEAWALFAPYYARIRHLGYARAVRKSLIRLFGVEDIRSEADAVRITEAMRGHSKPGFYDKILRDCNIESLLLFTGEAHQSKPYLHVMPVQHLIETWSADFLERYSGQTGGTHATLDGYADGLRALMRRFKSEGVRGIKFACAYNRDLDFSMPKAGEAREVYAKIRDRSASLPEDGLSLGELRPFQDYLVNVFTEEAGRLGLPVVFHTGIQAGIGNNLDRCRPERLWSLISGHRDTRFVLLHHGLPWIDEANMLAKYFETVSLDMAWVHIISPEIAKSALRRFIDMVPANKLIGFGGDYLHIENIPGHLAMARENITEALAETVRDGVMTLDDARDFQKGLLRDNARAIYAL